MSTCIHISEIKNIEQKERVCEDCIKTGDKWVHLRICRICGHIGCCDNSKNKHATKHFHETQHAIIQSYEPGENWAYCYIDKVYIENIQ